MSAPETVRRRAQLAATHSSAVPKPYLAKQAANHRLRVTPVFSRHTLDAPPDLHRHPQVMIPGCFRWFAGGLLRQDRPQPRLLLLQPSLALLSQALQLRPGRRGGVSSQPRPSAAWSHAGQPWAEHAAGRLGCGAGQTCCSYRRFSSSPSERCLWWAASRASRSARAEGQPRGKTPARHARCQRAAAALPCLSLRCAAESFSSRSREASLARRTAS